MNSLAPRIESFPDDRFSVDESLTATNSGRVLAAGYSFDSETNTAQVREDQHASPRGAILYADTVHAAPAAEDQLCETRLGLLKGRKLFRGLVSGLGGKFACYTGNFIIAEFHNVETALQCAVNLQIALIDRNAGVQDKHQIRYRLGVEASRTVSANGKPCSRADDMVAEVERGEHPGAIYISQLAREQLGKSPIVRLVSMGMRYSHSASEYVEAFWIEMDRSMLLRISQA